MYTWPISSNPKHRHVKTATSPMTAYIPRKPPIMMNVQSVLVKKLCRFFAFSPSCVLSCGRAGGAAGTAAYPFVGLLTLVAISP